MIRVGIGYDSHRFVKGNNLILGGVTIPHAYGLTGHSDADVVLHAIIDALLGAAALGDIGQWFSDTDPQWQDVSSITLLRRVLKEYTDNDYHINNIDVSIIAETPKLAPYIHDMQASIAQVVGGPGTCVSLKAKTNEGMGWIGRSEGIGVIAVAAVECPK